MEPTSSVGSGTGRPPTGSEQWPSVYAPKGGGPMTAWTFDPWRDDLLIEAHLGFA